MLVVTKPTDDKFNSLSFSTKVKKSLLYSKEKVRICAVYCHFCVANFPSDGIHQFVVE